MHSTKRHAAPPHTFERGDELAVLRIMSSALVHTMLRVVDLDRSLRFYVATLGMKVVRREEHPTGRFTLVFVGYGDEDGVTLELTHNWGGEKPYTHGTGFGHVAIAVDDVARSCACITAAGFTVTRPPGPMAHASTSGRAPEHIAFVRDPDGYPVELVER